MTTEIRRIVSAACPVCGGEQRPLLSLPAQPIYQHPVAAEADVRPPYAVDLAWASCAECAHAWQPDYDAGLLEGIYREHYYTPAPDGIAVQFRADFLGALEEFGLLRPRNALLEVGASSGDVLEAVRARTGAQEATAFEPDLRNAARARGRGLTVDESFFGGNSVARGREPADLAFARHVIEHVFDFGDFFAGLDGACAVDADLVLETPALDHHAGTESLDPFHVEHVHVFSRRSLHRLALAHGWRPAGDVVTADGNLIAWFRRSAPGDAPPELPQAPAGLDILQERHQATKQRLRRLLGGRRLVFWGAGSASIRLATLIGRSPDVWTDGNPAKVGMKFVGHERRILEPGTALTQASSGPDPGALLVIASSFQREILPRVRELGWRGDVVDLAGRAL